MKQLIIAYFVVGFVVSTYLLLTRPSARLEDTRWDHLLLVFPETWIPAVAFWPLYLVVRLRRTRRKGQPDTEQRESTEASPVGQDAPGEQASRN